MHPTCWSCMGNFARIIKKVPRIQEEPTLLTKNIYLYPLKSTIDCLSLVFKHPQSSIKIKTTRVWILHGMVCWPALLFKKRRGTWTSVLVHELPSKELSFDIWQQASRQIVFERKRTVGRGVHSWMNIACNSCKKKKKEVISPSSMVCRKYKEMEYAHIIELELTNSSM